MMYIITSLVGAILASIAITSVGGVCLWATCETLDWLF